MPTFHCRKLALIAFATIAISPAFADPSTDAVEFLRKVPDYRRAVEVVAQQYESSLRTHCTTVKLNWDSAKVYVAAPPTMDAQEHIRNGVWVETVSGEACKQQRQYNAVVVFQDGLPSVIPSFPGESESNPVLQRDTIIYVATGLTAAGALSKGCHIDVLETQLPEGHPKQGTPWIERWRVDACGKQYWAKVNYIPDATGTTINVSPKDVTLAK